MGSLPGDLAVVYASPPAWCCATLRAHETEPRRSEGPEPGSHSSAGCHSAERNSVDKSFDRFSLPPLTAGECVVYPDVVPAVATV